MELLKGRTLREIIEKEGPMDEEQAIDLTVDVIEGKSDIAIIGAGFSGSLLSMLLKRIGLTSVLIDRGSHPRFAIGESSTPIANLLLEDSTRIDGSVEGYTQMWTWHALEETEHKSVSYDVWNTVVKPGLGRYLLRTGTMLMTTAICKNPEDCSAAAASAK